VSGQMNLLAPPAEAELEVAVCPQVLLRGAGACDSRKHAPLFPHRHLPPAPSAMPGEGAWLAALDFAEEVRRYAQAPRPVLDLAKPAYSGVSGRSGPDMPSLWASSRGVEVDGALATWPRLLAGRAEQREVEPEVARARDLAEAYHYLDYYGGVYDEPTDGEDWSPVPLIRRLAAEARELGGDPTLLEPRSQYMRLALDPDSFANPQGEKCK
jgi:hypothetical protein